MHRLLLILPLTLLLASCMTSPYYEKSQSIPNNQWAHEYTPEFKFNVTDTTVYYNVFFILRFTSSYQYSNIWVNFYFRQPGDSTYQHQRIEVPLLAKSGQPFGRSMRAMGEITERRFFLDQVPLKKAGIYEIKLEQDMRVNPLPEILHAGILIEKTATPVNTAAPQADSTAKP